jgi:hypothetical protein
MVVRKVASMGVAMRNELWGEAAEAPVALEMMWLSMRLSEEMKKLTLEWRQYQQQQWRRCKGFHRCW